MLKRCSFFAVESGHSGEHVHIDPGHGRHPDARPRVRHRWERVQAAQLPGAESVADPRRDPGAERAHPVSVRPQGEVLLMFFDQL